MNEKEQREWIYNNYSHQAELVVGETFPNGDEMVIVSNSITEACFYILFPANGKPHEMYIRNTCPSLLFFWSNQSRKGIKS